MSVEITPAVQLGFHRPLTRLVTQTIKIHNPHPHPIAFKVKTTAPKQYCVRPNSGRVESGESVEVSVLLQPLAVDPPPHAKCKDKFLVQSAFITPDEEMHTLGEMWSATEAKNKSAIQEQKIKCVYLAAEDGRADNGIREEEEEGMESRVMDESMVEGKIYDPAVFRNGGQSYWESEASPYVHPARRAIFTAAQSSPTTKINGFNGDRSVNPEPQAESATPALPAALSSLGAKITPIVHSVLPTSTSTTQTETEKPRMPDLTAETIGATGAGVSPTNSALEQSIQVATTDKEKLSLALAEIEKLRAQLKASSAGELDAEASGPQVTGLRRRGGAAAGQAKEGAEVMLEKAKEVVVSSGGVPVEVVAALVVGVFVMTYLFF